MAQAKKRKYDDGKLATCPTCPNCGVNLKVETILTAVVAAQIKEENMLVVDTPPSEVHRQLKHLNQRQDRATVRIESYKSCGFQTDSESGSTRNLTFLQKSVDNPQNCLVQRQIDSNTAKMLVILQDGEQRLITFDIPNKDCTVQDLLEEVNIPICPETSISLVKDESLQINYVVEAGPGTYLYSAEDIKQSYTVSNTSPMKLPTNTDSSSPVFREVMTDPSIPEPGTPLICRTVRIGSYKCAPEGRVIISKTGIKMKVPLPKDRTNFVSLEVKFKDIVKVLIHFGKALPVLFFYTTTNAGVMIRELLGMQDPKGPYYDPAGKDHTHKRITLLPCKVINEESKLILRTLFAPNDLLAELNNKDANHILERSSPKDSWQVRSMMKKSGQTYPQFLESFRD